MLVESLLKVALFGAEWVMWLLLVLSVISIAVMFERSLFFRKYTEDIPRLSLTIRTAIRSGGADAADAALKERTSMEAEILRPTLRFMGAGGEALESSFRSEYDKRRPELEKGLNFLATVGSNAPFIGLFGTVIGVIEAFHHLGAGNDDAAMAKVMAGIAEALVATGVGLFVAIPAVVAYNIFQARVERVEEGIGALVNELSAVKEAEARGVNVSLLDEDELAEEAAADAIQVELSAE